MTANKKTVQEYMDAFNVTDHARILACLTDDVVAEGKVRTTRKVGGVLHLAFCDVFEMREGRIRRLTSYIAEIEG